MARPGRWRRRHALEAWMELQSTARVSTPKAAIYMKQLCRHFGHKWEVAFTDVDGSVEFPYGRCTLKAEADVLELAATAGDEESLERLQRVAAAHLVRFAFRDDLQIDWQRSSAGV